MPLAAGDKLQVKFFTQLGPQLGINIRHFNITAQVAVPTDQLFADALSLSFAPKIKNCMGNTALYFGLSVQRLVAGVWQPIATSKIGNGLGADATGVQAAQVAGLISLRTGLVGRANRGRAFVAFPGVAMSTPVPFPAPNANFNTPAGLYATWLTTVTIVTTDIIPSSNTLQGQIYHRATLSFTAMTAALVQPAWATQKRRGFFGRPNAAPF